MENKLFSNEKKDVVPEYMGIPIPELVRNQLAQYFGVKLLSDLQGSKLAKVHEEINEKLLDLYKSNRKLYAFLEANEEDEIISLKSLRDYFKDPPKNIKKKKLYAFLTLLGVKTEELEQFVKDTIYNKDKEYSYADLLAGPCTAYFFDSTDSSGGNIKCVPFWLTKTEKDVKGRESFSVRFKNPWKKESFEGKAKIFNENSIVFELNKKEMLMTIFAELPSIGNKLRNDTWILNAIGVANGQNNRPVRANMILVKNTNAGNEEIGKYMNREIVVLQYINTYIPDLNNELSGQKNSRANFDESAANSDGLTDEQRNQIIFYLSREENRDKTLKAFLPNNFDELSKRNSYYDKRRKRNEYERIKGRLSKNESGYGYYAFNRYRINKSEVAVFNYTFEFSDETHICKAIRHRIGQTNREEFVGEITLENEKLFFDMQDVEGQRRKQVIAPFAYEADQQHIIKAITSSVSTLNHQVLGLREIIVYLKEKDLKLTPEEKRDGYISYTRFYELDETILDQPTKLYLADRNNCVLTYPDKANSKHVYSRQAKACRYAGKYVLFCKGQRTAAGFLLKIILEIDPLAQATIEVRYNSNAYRLYTGECEAYSMNLKVQGFLAADHSSDQRNIVLIFDHIKEGYQLPDVYTGIVVGTDDNEGLAVAYSFLSVKVNDLSKNEIPEEVTTEEFKQFYKKRCSTEFTDIDHFFWKTLTNKPDVRF